MNVIYQIVVFVALLSLPYSILEIKSLRAEVERLNECKARHGG